MASILITGAAGFIGFHLHRKLAGKHAVSGIDSLAENLLASQARAQHIPDLIHADCSSNFIDKLERKPEIVIHLAADTGIKHSQDHPGKYLQNNVSNTFNVLEQCRQNGVKYFIYASSSSVYEANQSVMREDAATERQLSFYGTTKKMSEIMIENYCRQYGMVAIGLRFFTVYGSWTRTDMAAYKFMQLIEQDLPVTIYNEGNVYRDFTHVSDIVHAIDLLVDKIREEEAPFHALFNIGHGAPVSVLHYAETIARQMQKELKTENKALPSNELDRTHCDTSRLQQYVQFKPRTSVDKGVEEMVHWYLNHRYE